MLIISQIKIFVISEVKIFVLSELKMFVISELNIFTVSGLKIARWNLNSSVILRASERPKLTPSEKDLESPRPQALQVNIYFNG